MIWVRFLVGLVQLSYGQVDLPRRKALPYVWVTPVNRLDASTEYKGTERRPLLPPTCPTMSSLSPAVSPYWESAYYELKPLHTVSGTKSFLCNWGYKVFCTSDEKVTEALFHRSLPNC